MLELRTMPVAMTLEELYRPIHAELSEVRNEVKGLLHDIVGIVGEQTAGQLPFNGGKLLRPALCLLSAGACGARDLRRFVPLAAAMEVLHLAALAHDDVIDGAGLRRGASSLNALWDDRAAVLGGDYLVARALTMMTSYRTCALVDDAVDTIRQMTEGELYSFGHRHDRPEIQKCIDLARKKTAVLFATACATPARQIEGAPYSPLYDYGMGVGIAFQLVDDLLDLSQNEETLGKPACGDVVEGKKTLPILFMRENLSANDIARLAAMEGSTLSDLDREWVALNLEQTGARTQTEEVARKYASDGLAALDALHMPNEYAESMQGLTEFVLTRGS